MKSKRGITLIALVVTIVVLLILAGVSISMLSGENGIITQAENSSIKNDNGTVLESLRLKISEYIADNNGVLNGDKMQLLFNDNIINDESIVNVEELVGEKLKTGNGSNNKDVYTIEDNHLYYYTKKEEKIDLGNLGDLGNILVESDPDLFLVDDDGNLTLKYANEYYKGTMEWTIENLVIPKEVDGKVVKTVDLYIGVAEGLYNLKTVVIPDNVIGIRDEAFSNCTGLTSITIPNSVTSIGKYVFSGCRGLTDITIPNSVTNIGTFAFYWCRGLTSITIPNNVTNIGNSVFYGWTSSQTINVQFKENELPNGWDTDWKNGCDATINYLQ